MGGYPSRFWAFITRADPETPVKGIVPRLKNIAFNNYRGLLGFVVLAAFLALRFVKGQTFTVQAMWIIMFGFFLLQPVNIPVTALIPLFMLPMGGILSSVDVCKCYMNDNVVLFILSGMLVLLMNNSGVDRRIMLWFLCSSDTCRFSGWRLVLKSSTACFFLSMFSSRLIVTSTMMTYIAPVLMNLQYATSGYRATEPNYDEIRFITCQSIQTASAIGSIAVPHASLATLAFRAMFYESPPKGFEYPDIFNYLQYSVYAFPVALVMHIVTSAYHIMLVNKFMNKGMSLGSQTQFRKEIMKYKRELPKQPSNHEKLTVIFTVLSMAMFYLRWSSFLGSNAWANFRREESSPEIPGLKDATVAAMFVIILHTLPKGLGFSKVFTSKKKSDLPPLKPESAILWWRFVDKNMNYGYIFMLGCGVALVVALRETKIGVEEIASDVGKIVTGQSWMISVLMVCTAAVAAANCMSSVAACAMWMPFVLHMCQGADVPAEWQNRAYLGALGVGVGSSFGFMFPFLYTPAYFCHYVGKVPKEKMVRYGLGSAIICMIILWLSLMFWAPFVWDPENNGISWVNAPGDASTDAPEVDETDAPAPD